MRNLNKRFTKIVSTLGPATFDRLDELLNSGVDVLRFNFSHGNKDEKKMIFNRVLEIEKKLDKKFVKIADLQGPKHRIGSFKDTSALLKSGEIFNFDKSKELGDETRVYLPHFDVFDVIKKDDIILINDGQLTMQVLYNTGDSIKTEIIVGGEISDKKGANFPTIVLNSSIITDKDRIDLEDAIDIGFNFIVASFVQTEQDMKDFKALCNGRIKIIAKLEKPLVMDYLEGIIEQSDGVMVGRGDFAIEASYEKIPFFQKQIVQACIKQNKPVIIATQMMESMIDNPFPTRAEVSDVANSIYECADCVMTSAETAKGKYPIKTIEIMDKIISEIETKDSKNVLEDHTKFSLRAKDGDKDFQDIKEKVSVLLTVKPDALLVIKADIKKVALLSRLRLNIPIYSAVNEDAELEAQNLFYGINAMKVKEFSVDSIKDIISKKTNFKKIQEI